MTKRYDVGNISCWVTDMNQRSFAIVGLTLWAVIVVSAVALATPYLDRHTFCHSIGSASSDYRPIRESHTFYTNDAEVYGWIRLKNVRGPHTIHWLWIDPNKFDSFLSEYHIPAGTDPNLPYYAWSYMYLDNGSTPIGKWRLLVYIDGDLLYQDTFTILPGWMDEMESNDTPARAELVQMGEQIHGFTTREDEDWFKLTVTQSGHYYIEFAKYWSYSDLMLSVFSAADLQTPLVHLDDREASESGWDGYWDECVLLTRPGVYYIRVHGDTSTETEYWVNLKERMPWWIK